MEIEELLLRLDYSSDMTLKEMEDIQDTLNEQGDELRTKITMVKDEERRTKLEAERLQVLDALTRIEERIDEKRRMEQDETDGQSGLSVYRGDEADEQSGLSAYQGDEADGQSGLSAYQGDETDEWRDSGKHHKNEPKMQEQKDNWQEIKDAYRKAVSDQDIDQMKKLYTRVSEAAEKGDADAVIALGALSTYENNDHDTVKNRRLLHSAMEMGSFEACEKLLLQLEEAKVVKPYKAWNYYEEMIEIGFTKALILLARQYEERGTGWLDKDYMRRDAVSDLKNAIGYYKRYVDEYEGEKPDDAYRECLYGSVNCEWKIGEEFQGADSIRKRLLLLLEHEGSYTSEAKVLLGDGLCGEDKYREAVGCYLDSGSDTGIARILQKYDQIAENGDGRAIDSVLEGMIQDTGRYKATRNQKGMILVWKGDRCKKDEQAAFGYYCQAAGIGNKDALQKRNAIVRKYQNKNYIEAVTFFESSANSGNHDAYKYLGDIYAVNHRGIRHDYKMALEYYIRGKNGTMKEMCESLAADMKKKMRQETAYSHAENMLRSANQAARKEGMDMMKLLAKEGFTDAVKYLEEN